MKIKKSKQACNSYELERRFIAFFWFVGWDCISLGFHICISKPNIEIHIPFGFIRIGMQNCSEKPRLCISSCGNGKNWGIGWID